jgi:Zn-dependent protease with chaperone function
VIWALAALVVIATSVPHLLPPSRLSPLTGVTLWLGVLGVRAFLVAVAALAVILFAPTTQLFEMVTHWCFHAVIPFLAAHLGFSAHSVGDAAILLPAVGLAISALSASFAIWRGGRRVRTWLRRSSLGDGPKKSVIVGGPEVVLAATGIRKARVVVSVGALATLEDDELAAGLEHEQGHIMRRHPYLATLAEVLFALARVLPGSREALAQLHFHLERDADEYAIRRTGNPLALASVICKASGGQQRQPAMIGLANAAANARIKLLLEHSTAPRAKVANLAGRGLAAVLVGIALLLAASVPAIAASGIAALEWHGSAAHCKG